MLPINVWRDPHGIGVSLTKPKQIELKPGLTVFVGCNGAGKTTLATNVREEVKKAGIPCVFYDNQSDGGNSSFSSIISGCAEYESDDMGTAISLWNASEGEAIRLNVSRHSTLYKEFLQTGFFKNKSYRIARIFKNDAEKEEQITDNRRVFIYDATDSGMSIDAVVELKEMFKNLLNASVELGLETYIIITANEYEMCRGEECFDVVKGSYISFADYEDYRNFIIANRAYKEKRLDKQEIWQEKQTAKEKVSYEAFVAKTKEKIAKLEAKSELSFSDKYKISELKREISRRKRELQFYSPPDEF